MGRTKILSLDMGLIKSLSAPSGSTDEPNPKIERMKKIVRIAMETELTQRQRDCINMRFFEGKKVEEIADILCVRPTTVYKHLKLALRKLKECGKYL